MIVRKSAAEIAKIASAGAILADCIDALTEAAAPGVSTAELDRLAEKFIRQHKGVPTFLGYRGFPASICASPNDMVVHGIPGKYRAAEGDLLSIDVGVTLDGYVADSAVTLPMGAVEPEAQRLLDVTRGVARGRPGRVPGGPASGRHLARRAGGRRGRRLQRGTLPRRPRCRQGDARGSTDPQLR